MCQENTHVKEDLRSVNPDLGILFLLTDQHRFTGPWGRDRVGVVIRPPRPHPSGSQSWFLFRINFFEQDSV